MLLICPSERNLLNAYSIHSIMNRSFLFSTFRARNLEKDTLFFYFSSSSFFITKIMTDSSFHTTKTRKYIHTHIYIYIYIIASASLGSSRVYSFSRPRHYPYILFKGAVPFWSCLAKFSELKSKENNNLHMHEHKRSHI